MLINFACFLYFDQGMCSCPGASCFSYIVPQHFIAVLGATLSCFSDEFTIFYGVRTNADFLVHNGFVPSGGDNPHDAYILKLGVSKNDPGAADKLEMLDILSIPRHSPYFSLSQVLLMAKYLSLE